MEVKCRAVSEQAAASPFTCMPFAREALYYRGEDKAGEFVCTDPGYPAEGLGQ